MALWSNTLYNILTSGSRLVVNSIFLLLLARGLEHLEFGRLTYALAFSNIMFIIVEYGFTWQVVRDVARQQSLTTAIIADIIPAKLVLSFMVVAGGGAFSLLFGRDWETILLVNILTLSTPFFSFGHFYGVIFRGHHRFDQEAKSTLFLNLALLLSGLLVFYLTRNAVHLGLTFLATRVLYFFYARRLYYRAFGVPAGPFPGWSQAWRMLRVGLPFGLFLMGGIMLINLDTIFLEYFKGPEAVADYQAGVRLMMAFQVVMEILTGAYYPLLSQKFYNDRPQDAIDVATQLNRFLLLAGLPVATLFLLFPHLLVHVTLGARYEATTWLLPIFGLILLLRFVGSSYGAVLAAVEQQRLRALAVMSALALSVALNVLLIPAWGGQGAAWAALISHVFLSVSYALLTYRYVRHWLIDRRFLLFLALISGTYGIIYWGIVPREEVRLLLLAAILLLGLYVGLRREEKLSLWRALKRRAVSEPAL